MNELAGIPILLESQMRDGTMLVGMSIDPTGPSSTASQYVMLGTQRTYVDSTIRRITREVFDEAFLKKIGMWEPTSDEILAAMRDETARRK